MLGIGAWKQRLHRLSDLHIVVDIEAIREATHSNHPGLVLADFVGV